MILLEEDLKKTTPRLCKVDSGLLKYLHKCDHRVSVKKERVFVGLAVYINGKLYLIPLTSVTCAKRISEGKKPRPNTIITKVMDGAEEIADLLYNNMIPVDENYITDIIIDPDKDSYLANEERFIRKNWVAINVKAISIYRNRYNALHRDYDFLTKMCCDFRKLEDMLKNYQPPTQ